MLYQVEGAGKCGGFARGLYELWHASAQVPLVASNRIGTEEEITFYGGSFICDNKGAILQQVSMLVLSAVRAGL